MFQREKDKVFSQRLNQEPVHWTLEYYYKYFHYFTTWRWEWRSYYYFWWILWWRYYGGSSNAMLLGRIYSHYCNFSYSRDGISPMKWWQREHWWFWWSHWFLHLIVKWVDGGEPANVDKIREGSIYDGTQYHEGLIQGSGINKEYV